MLIRFVVLFAFLEKLVVTQSVSPIGNYVMQVQLQGREASIGLAGAVLGDLNKVFISFVDKPVDSTCGQICCFPLT